MSNKEYCKQYYQKNKDYFKAYYQNNKDKDCYKPRKYYFILILNDKKFLFKTKKDILSLVRQISKQDITSDMIKQ